MTTPIQKDTKITKSTHNTNEEKTQTTDDKKLLKNHPDFDHVKHFRRYAKNPKHYDQMVAFMGRMDTEEEAKKVVLMFLLDMKYARTDIAHACKAVSKTKGWNL